MATDKYNVFIVDVYNLIYKATWVQDENIITYKNQSLHTEGIIGFFKMMDSYTKTYAEDNLKIYWLFDNAKTSIQKYRKSLSEDYKKTRVEQPEWFYRQIDMLELILKYYKDNSFLYRVKFVEADDYVPKIIDLYTSDVDNVLLISDDSDWFRALSSKTNQLAKGKIYNNDLFFEEYGFLPSYKNILFYKTFYGDATDNIKSGLPYFPKSMFLKVLESCESIHDFILKSNNKQLDFMDLGWIAKINKEEELLRLNWNLVEYVDINNIDMRSFETKCSFNPEKLYLIYDSLNLLGKIDSRVKVKQNTTSILDDLLSGVDLSRKKV